MRPIAILKLGGLAAKLLNRSVFKGTTGPTHATGAINVQSNGVVTGDGVSSYTWLLRGLASAYEIRATLQSSSGVDSQTGTYGTWLSLAGGQSWSFTENSNSTTATILLEIRPAGGSTITSCNVDFDCEVA